MSTLVLDIVFVLVNSLLQKLRSLPHIKRVRADRTWNFVHNTRFLESGGLIFKFSEEIFSQGVVAPERYTDIMV